MKENNDLIERITKTGFVYRKNMNDPTAEYDSFAHLDKDNTVVNPESDSDKKEVSLAEYAANNQEMMIPDEPYLNYEHTMDFESFYDYLEKTTINRDEDIYKANIILSSNLEMLKGSEGFIDSVKLFGKKIIQAIIAIVKALINWIKNFIFGLGRFIRDNVIYKLFGKPKNKEVLEKISAAYDRFSNLSVSWTGLSNKSTESNAADEILVSHNDEEIEPLSDSLKQNLPFMNFNKDNFDIINRVAAITTSAVDSMKQCLERNIDTNDVLRAYGIRYGNKDEEDIYTTFVKNNPDKPVSKMYFYHEKAFLEFIFFIDKLTHGNLDKLIEQRSYSPFGTKYGNTLESKLNLDINGTDVANAIILNCSLEDLNNIKKKAENIDPEKITIKDIISKDVLLRIISGNNAILDKLSHEASITLKINEKLDPLLKIFIKHIEEIDKRLQSINYEPINGFVTVQETEKWIQFMVAFSNRFMIYRLDMIKIIRRIIKILVKKTNDDNLKEFLVKDGTSNSILGIINIYSNETFLNLPYSKLVEEAKYISEKQMKNMYYSNKYPICVIPITEPNVSRIHYFKESVGHAIPVFSELQEDLFKKIQSALRSNANENTLINLFIKLNGKIRKGNLLGAIALIDVNGSMISYKNNNYFLYCINYYGYIIHETTHAIRFCTETIHTDDYGYNTAHRSEIIEGKIEKRRNKLEHDIINNNFINNVYYLSSHEAEAFKEQYNFLMSTIRYRDINFKDKAEKHLKMNFIHGTHYVQDK